MVVRRVVGPNLPTFDEDLRSAWVPDVVGGADAHAVLGLSAEDLPAAAQRPVEWLRVPKPDGTWLRAPVLSLPWLALLNRAVAPLKDAVDDALAPSVCGYRRGAEPGGEYSREHRRFSEFARAQAADAAVVVSADVRRFFAATSWATAHAACERLAPTATTVELDSVIALAQSAGLTHLPAGYADARFLANLVLVEADQAIGLPFARWVDDYRIFTSSTDEAEGALARLAGALEHVGLMLNESKVRLRTADEFLRSCGASFTSVYHPEYEDRETVRAALRTVFLDAANEPSKHRRSIRFALPRLGDERDDIAVPWALGVIREIPWDAPRLVAYLGNFADRPSVRSGANDLLTTALLAGDDWLASRVAPLVCLTGVDRGTVEALTDTLASTQSPSVWGLCLRALALSMYRDIVASELEVRILDERAAVAACLDAGLPLPAMETSAGRVAARCLDGPAPLPRLDTIL